MDDIFGFVGDFFKAMFAFAIIVAICGVFGWIVSSLFGGEVSSDKNIEQEFSARCLSVGGTRSYKNCYKDGEIVFSKEEE